MRQPRSRPQFLEDGLVEQDARRRQFTGVGDPLQPVDGAQQFVERDLVLEDDVVDSAAQTGEHDLEPSPRLLHVRVFFQRRTVRSRAQSRRMPATSFSQFRYAMSSRSALLMGAVSKKARADPARSRLNG